MESKRESGKTEKGKKKRKNVEDGSKDKRRALGTNTYQKGNRKKETKK